MHGRNTLSSLLQHLAAVACALLLCAAPVAAQRAGQPGEPRAPQLSAAPPGFHETLIAEIPPEGEVGDWQAAGSHLAWVEWKGGQWATSPSGEAYQSGQWIVRLDGKQQGGTYDDVKHLEFAPGGAHLAFFAKRDWKWALVTDGQERSPGYATVTSLAFQPHGSSWAYGACIEETKCQLVVDGKAASAVYDGVGRPVYSPDGKRLAYFGQRAGKWVAVVDGREMGPAVENYSDFGFSPDSRHFFSAAMVKGLGWTSLSSWAYIVDGTPGPSFTELSPIAFSPNGKHYAYAASNAGLGLGGWKGLAGGRYKLKTTGTIVLDGRPGPSYKGTGLWIARGSPLPPAVETLPAHFFGASDPLFDFEGRLIYAVRRGENDTVVMHGNQTGPQFDDVVSEISVFGEAKHFGYIARRGKELVVVLDNQPTSSTFPIPENLRSVRWCVITPDGKHRAWEEVHGGFAYQFGETSRARRTVVMDGIAGKDYNALGISDVAVSGDWRHYWYEVLGAAGKRDLVVADGRESRLFDDLTGLDFAADGSSVAFFARDKSRLLRLTFPLP